MYMSSGEYHSVVNVNKCLFTGNYASEVGSHVFLYINDAPDNNSVLFYDCRFEEGFTEIGGAVYIESDSASDESGDGNSVVVSFVLCTFSRNRGVRYTGALVYIQNQVNSNVHLTLSDCLFENNSASIFAAASFEFNSPIDIVTYPPVTLDNCRWINNRLDNVGGLGCIHTFIIPLNIQGNTTIQHCVNGPALNLEYSPVTLIGSVLFQENIGAVYGGDVYMVGTSVITLTPGVQLHFLNSLAVYGGAIFFDFSYLLRGQSSFPCVFQYSNMTVTDISDGDSWNATVIFEGVSASAVGQAAYLHNFETCSQDKISSVFLSRTFIGTSSPGAVSSPPVNLTFHYPAIWDESLQLYSMSTMLGEYFLFNVTAVDILGQATVAVTTAYLECNANSQIKSSDHTAFVFGDYVIQSSFYLYGPQVTSSDTQCYLHFQTVTQPVVQAKLLVNISECYLGWVYNSSEQTCACYMEEMGSPQLQCYSNYACVEQGYWFGSVSDNTSDYLLKECYKDRCNPESKCSPGYCPSSSGYCQLPLSITDQDSQCTHNRGGPYCSLCNNESVFTFYSVNCIPASSCYTWHIVLLTIMYLCLWLGILSVFVLSLKVHWFSIKPAYLYAFVYYFSVINSDIKGHHLAPLANFVHIYGSMVQLNPAYLGLLPLCTYTSLDKLSNTALAYLNPILLTLGWCTFLVLARRCRINSLPKHTPVHCLATIILVTFTSLNQVSVDILRSVSFPNGVYVFIQPNIRYFHQQHIGFAILAISVELFLLIPFTFLMLFAPLMSHHLNFVKLRLKPVLDSFQYCFRDSMRWMVGFYFLARLVLLVIYLLELSSRVMTGVEIVFSISILFIIVLAKPYHSSRLNIIDSFLLLNLTLVQVLLLIGEQDNSILELLRATVLYLLVLTAASYGVGMVFYLVGSKLKTYIPRKLSGSVLRARWQASKPSFVDTENDDSDLPVSSSLEQPSRLSKFYNPSEFRDSTLNLLASSKSNNSDGGAGRSKYSSTLPITLPHTDT